MYCLCICVLVCAHECKFSKSPEEGIRSPGNGMVCGCGLPDVCELTHRNWTQVVVCKPCAAAQPLYPAPTSPPILRVATDLAPPTRAFTYPTCPTLMLRIVSTLHSEGGRMFLPLLTQTYFTWTRFSATL